MQQNIKIPKHITLNSELEKTITKNVLLNNKFKVYTDDFINITEEELIAKIKKGHKEQQQGKCKTLLGFKDIEDFIDSI